MFLFLFHYLPPNTAHIPNMADEPTYTLPEFIGKFSQIRAADPQHNSPHPDFLAARFGLTGQAPNGPTCHIDALRGRLIPETPSPMIRRDFDSVIGFTDIIPVSSDLQYYPNPAPARSLNKSIHIEIEFQVSETVCERANTSKHC